MSETFQTKDAAAAATNAGKKSVEALAQAGRDSVKAADETGRQAAGAMADAARTANTRAGEAMSAGVEQSRQGAETMANYGRTVAESFQAIAGAWAEYARTGAERNLERMNALLAARNPVDVMSAQRDLVWGGVEDLMGAQERIRQISVRMMGGAAGKPPASVPTQGLVA